MSVGGVPFTFADDKSDSYVMNGYLRGLRPAIPPRPLSLLLGGMVVFFCSCANPQPPSGGPRDETPPSIVRTDPVQDTVNVSTDRRSVEIEFSEYVERSTLSQALTITPPVDGRLRFSWSGQAVSIELPSTLRDSTTYLFTFDTNLRDAHSVALTEPLTYAFSTGPQIDKGEIRGRVVEPSEGTPQQNLDVFAYPVTKGDTSAVDSLPETPAYRIQTGEDGRFTFRYMREQPYYVVALQDNNRNRQPDAGEPYAVPPRFAIRADSGKSAIPVPWLYTQADTLRPTLQRVRPRSRRRVQLVFSEPIELASRRPTDWVLRDSVANAFVQVRSVYRPAGRQNAVIVRTARMDSTRHHLSLTPNLVSDTLRQPLVPDTARFRGVSRDDTTRTRFRTFVPEDLSQDSAGVYRLLPPQKPGVRFNQSVDSTRRQEIIAVQDTTGRSLSHTLTSRDGRTYRLQLDSPLSPGSYVDVLIREGQIAGPDTTRRRRFRRVTDRVLGELEGTASFSLAQSSGSEGGESVQGPPPGFEDVSPVDTMEAKQDVGRDTAERDVETTGPIVVELIPTQSTLPLDPRQQTVAPDSTFLFSALPEGTFRFRAYGDRNDNGRWDGGFISPYDPAEPIGWSDETTDSRPRWTNVISSPLRISILEPGSTPDAPSRDTTKIDSINR